MGSKVVPGITGIRFRCRSSRNKGGLPGRRTSIVGCTLLNKGSRNRKLPRNFGSVCDNFRIYGRYCTRVVRVINHIERLARLERVRTFAALCEIVHCRHYNIVQQLPINKQKIHSQSWSTLVDSPGARTV